MIRLIFSCGDDEHLPLLIGYGHNLKEENLCEGKLIELENIGSSRKYKIETSYKNKNTEVFLSYSDKELVNAYLITNNNRIPIKDYRRYVSLQIGKYCYDDIYAFRLFNNVF